MAVYTQVSDAALAEFLSGYDIGCPLSFKGIAEGVENSNYFLETSQGKFILTLFEKRTNPQDLPYFIGLKQHLAATGFPCPEPIVGTDGDAIREMEGRPAIIVSFLTGLSVEAPDVHQCGELGQGMAKMHGALTEFRMQRPNSLGPPSWPKLWDGRAKTANTLRNGLGADIDEDLHAIAQANPNALNLPSGTIHADLFPDNVFFMGSDFSGIIDFYFACTGALVYDIAICLNAWCFDKDGTYDFDKGRALIAGYEAVRPLEPAEKDALPILARGAAIRFFLTRLIDWTDIPSDALVRPKDPLEYAQKLDWHRRYGESAENYGV